MKRELYLACVRDLSYKWCNRWGVHRWVENGNGVCRES